MVAKAQPIDLAVVDAKELKKLKEKQEKIDRVMKLIKENNLQNDKEFMEEVMEAFDGILDV
jgi:predicted nucleotidyltransferase